MRDDKTSNQPFLPNEPWWGREFNHTQFYYNQYCMLIQTFIKETVESDNMYESIHGKRTDEDINSICWTIEQLTSKTFYVDTAGNVRVLTYIIMETDTKRLIIDVGSPSIDVIEKIYTIIKDNPKKKQIDLMGYIINESDVATFVRIHRHYNMNEKISIFDAICKKIATNGIKDKVIMKDNFCPNQTVILLIMLEILCNSFVHVASCRMLNWSVIDVALEFCFRRDLRVIPSTKNVLINLLDKFETDMKQNMMSLSIALTQFISNLTKTITIDTSEQVFIRPYYSTRLWTTNKEDYECIDTINALMRVIPIYHVDDFKITFI